MLLEISSWKISGNVRSLNMHDRYPFSGPINLWDLLSLFWRHSWNSTKCTHEKVDHPLPAGIYQPYKNALHVQAIEGLPSKSCVRESPPTWYRSSSYSDICKYPWHLPERNAQWESLPYLSDHHSYGLSASSVPSIGDIRQPTTHW